MVLTADDILYACGGGEKQIQKFSIENPPQPCFIKHIKFSSQVCKSMIISKNKEMLYVLTENSEMRRIKLDCFELDIKFKIESVYNLYLSSMISCNLKNSIIYYKQSNIDYLTKKDLQKNRIEFVPNKNSSGNACLLDEKSNRIIFHSSNDFLRIGNYFSSKRIDKTNLNEKVNTITVLSETAKCYEILVSSWKNLLILFNIQNKAQIIQMITIHNNPYVINISQDLTYVGIGGSLKNLMILKFLKDKEENLR